MPVPWKRLFQLIVVLLGLGLLLDLASRLGAELLWFQEVAYLSVFLLKFQVRLGLLAVVTGFTAVYLLGNLALAQRLKYLPDPSAVHPSEKLRKPSLSPYKVKLPLPSPPPIPSTVALRLRSLLPLTLLLSLLVGLLLLYYGQLAVHYWQDGATLSSPLVSRLNLKNLWQTTIHLRGQVWLLGGMLGVAIALLESVCK